MHDIHILIASNMLEFYGLSRVHCRKYQHCTFTTHLDGKPRYAISIAITFVVHVG